MKDKINIRNVVLWGLPILAICLLVGLRLWENVRNRGHTFIPMEEPNRAQVFHDKYKQYEPLKAESGIHDSSIEGVRIFDGEKWTHYTEENSRLLSNRIYTVSFDSKGRAWLATTNKIYFLDEEYWKIYSSVTTGLKGFPRVIVFDPEGNTWVGDSRGYISIFDGESWEVMSTPDSNLGSMVGITAIVFDEQDRAWIGSRGYARIFDGNTWEYFSLDPSGNSWVNDIAIDSEGRIWISWLTKYGRRLSGVSILDLDEFTPWSTAGDIIFGYKAAGGDWLVVLLLGLIWGSFLSEKSDKLGKPILFIWGAGVSSLVGFMIMTLILSSSSGIELSSLYYLVSSLLLGIPSGGIGAIILSRKYRNNARIAVLGGLIGGILMTPCEYIGPILPFLLISP